MMKHRYTVPILSVLTGGFLMAGCTHSVPKCDSKEAKDLIAQMVNEKPYTLGNFVGIKDVEEEAYNKEGKVRICTATVTTTKLTEDVRYSVTLTDEKKGEYEVEMRER